MNNDTPLGEAKRWLRDMLDDGATCPCCGQHAQAYKRKLTAPIGKVLIDMWRRERDGWVYLPAIRSAGQDEAIARHWGLIETMPDTVRDDGSKRHGYWRLTPHGTNFVRIPTYRVAKWARIYNNRLLALDYSETVTMIDVLSTRFDYTELMTGT